MSDEAMGTSAPIMVYWLYAGFYQLLPPLDKYRLHTRREEDEKNSVPLSSIVNGVLLQQLALANVAQGLFVVSFYFNFTMSKFVLNVLHFHFHLYIIFDLHQRDDVIKEYKLDCSLPEKWPYIMFDLHQCVLDLF